MRIIAGVSFMFKKELLKFIYPLRPFQLLKLLTFQNPAQISLLVVKSATVPRGNPFQYYIHHLSTS